MFSEGGLIKRAEQAKEMQEKEALNEKLQLAKATLLTSFDDKGNRKELTVDNYIEELIKEGIIDRDDVTDNGDGTKQVTTEDGDVITVRKDEETGEIITEIEGKADKLPVKIKEIKLTTSTNSIKVDVEVKRGEGAKYKYYYKKQDTTDAFKLAKESNSTSYTIENLEQNVTYVIKVEATNENGTVSKEATGRTVEIPDAQTAIEFSSPIWNNGKAEVTITKTTSDSMKMQYRVTVGETIGEYQEIASGAKITNLELGSIVTARLWDGTNGGNTTNLNIQDLRNPNEATITLSEQIISVGETITASVSQSDNESGIDILRCKWIYNQTSTKLGEDETSYTGKFTSASETISLTTTNPGDYYLHVLTVDKAGNKTEKISEKITVKEIEVESIRLDKTTLKIGLGKTSEALNVTFTPANAKDKTITWSSNATSIATVTDGKVTGVAEGTATITATTANGKTATCNVTVGMTIAEAKAKVTSYATLQQYIGKEVIDYNPTAGGTWRIFYYDEAGDFGTAGKLYLKRDFDSSLQKALDATGTYTNTDEAIIKMKAMNPKWAASTNASSIDLEIEKAVAWLCNPANWTDYKTTEADYAIGSPSVEMYMKAYNVWKDNNKNSTTLICKIGNANGYSVGANGTYDNSGYCTNNSTIEAGPNNIFMTAGENWWWLASPSSNTDGYDAYCVLVVYGSYAGVLYTDYISARGVCPVVSL